MLPELDSLLRRGSQQSVEGGQFILCSQEGADATFILHHYISSTLKSGGRVCLLALSQAFVHYNNIAKKLGVDLQVSRNDGNFIFIEGVKNIGSLIVQESAESAKKEKSDEASKANVEADEFSFITDKSQSLRQLYINVTDKCMALLEQTEQSVVFLIDELSLLLSLGVAVRDIYGFITYVKRKLLKEGKGKISIVVMVTKEDVDDDSVLLYNLLRHQSNLEMHASGLKSGYSKDVHGQLTITWRDAESLIQGHPEQKQMQFKITDKTVTFFARGTSSAVL